MRSNYHKLKEINFIRKYHYYLFYGFFPNSFNPNKFPPFYSIILTLSFIQNLKSLEKKISFIDILLINLMEIYTHRSDEDIERFMKKYHLRGYCFDYKSQLFNDKTMIEELKYVSIKYKKFQRAILIEIALYLYYLVVYRFIQKLFEKNFDLVFSKAEFVAKYDSFDDDNIKIEWCRKLLNFLYAITYKFDEGCFYILYEKYNLYKKYKMDKKSFRYFISNSVKYSRFRSFKTYLVNGFIPFVKDIIDKIDFEKILTEAVDKYPDKFKDDDDKYPLFYFNYDRIIQYSEKIFIKIEEKIKYYNYIIYSFNINMLSTTECEKNKELTISRLKFEIERLMTIFELENKNSNVTLITDFSSIRIPKSRQYAKLTAHYFNIAKEIEAIPTYEQLVTAEWSVPFWSKEFKDINFLSLMYKKIESMISSKRISKKTKSFYIEIKNDISSKIDKAIKIERSKINTKSSREKSINENFKDESAYDESQYHDKSEDD